jgi:hypothetical protein
MEPMPPASFIYPKMDATTREVGAHRGEKAVIMLLVGPVVHEPEDTLHHEVRGGSSSWQKG